MIEIRSEDRDARELSAGMGPVESGNWAKTRIEKQKNERTAQADSDFISLSLTKALLFRWDLPPSSNPES